MRKPRNESRFKQRLRRFLLCNPLMIYKTVDGHILTQDATKVLVCCVYDIDDAFYFDYTLYDHHIDCYLSKQMNRVEIFTALQYLQRLGFVENLRGTKDRFTLHMTHEGMHFFEIRRKNFVYLMLNSIFLPLIISAVTSIITLLIAG